MTNYIIPNNVTYINYYALKSVPGLVEVRVPLGDGDGPRTPLRCMEGI